MSRRFFCAVAVACMAMISTANANYQCGCGQVASPIGDTYGSSVIDAGLYGGGYGMGGVAYGDAGMSGGISYGGAGITSGIQYGGDAGFAGGGFAAGCGCGPTITYQTQTVYEQQMVTQMLSLIHI